MIDKIENFVEIVVNITFCTLLLIGISTFWGFLGIIIWKLIKDWRMFI